MSESTPTPSRDDARAPALAHLNVIDLSTGIAGQYCGKMFATMGASVTLVEPPEGTATRSLPPHLHDGESALFQHLNQGKRSTILPAESGTRADALAGILAAADVVIADRDAALPALPEYVVECRIGDFPADGPYADWRADEMIHQALSGYMNATGRSDRQPLYGVGNRAYYACGTAAFVASLAALHERRRSGSGQRVGASVFESVATIGQNFVTQAEYNGTTETRARYTGLLATLRCRDGFIVMFAIRDAAAVCRLFDSEHLIDDPRFAKPGSMIRDWDTLVTVFADRALEMTTDEVVARAQSLRISCERVWTIDELIDSEQWRERGMLRSVDGADESQRWALGPLFRISGAPQLVASSPPHGGIGRINREETHA